MLNNNNNNEIFPGMLLESRGERFFSGGGIKPTHLFSDQDLAKPATFVPAGEIILVLQTNVCNKYYYRNVVEVLWNNKKWYTFTRYLSSTSSWNPV
jgi:hypothetical protein